MLIKKKPSGFIRHLLTRLNRAVACRKTSVVIKKLGSSSKLLDILVADGYIKSYVEYPDLVVVSLKISFFGRRSDAITSLVPVTRYGRKTALPLCALKANLRRTGTTPFIILHTDKGLLTGLEAVKRNVGGKGLIQLT
jgi:ribosomal protein S8